MKKDIITCDNCEQEFSEKETFEIRFMVGTKSIGHIRACKECKNKLEIEYKKLIQDTQYDKPI